MWRTIALLLLQFQYIDARHPFLIFYDGEGNKQEEIRCVRESEVNVTPLVTRTRWLTVGMLLDNAVDH